MRQFLIAALFAASMIAPAFAAGSESDYKTALAAAEKADAEAGKLKNQWSTTEQALKAAQKEAAAGDFAKATELAKHAEALAKASVAQSKQQAKVWRRAAAVR